MLFAAGRAPGFHHVGRPAHQFLELVSAGFATVFVDRHSYNDIIAPALSGRARFKPKPYLPQINLVPRAQRHTPAGVRGNIDPAPVPKQGRPDGTAVVEDTPVA